MVLIGALRDDTQGVLSLAILPSHKLLGARLSIDRLLHSTVFVASHQARRAVSSSSSLILGRPHNIVILGAVSCEQHMRSIGYKKTTNMRVIRTRPTQWWFEAFNGNRLLTHMLVDVIPSVICRVTWSFEQYR